MTEHEYVLVGGGLQNALIAMALLGRARPPSIALVERGERLGGNHTWCFHRGDLPAGGERWIDPLVAHRWAGHEVLFPTLRRRIETGYAAITSERLDAVVRERLGDGVLLGRAARAVEEHRVVLEDGEVIAGRVVIDARGPAEGGAGCGYQKFLGVELALARPHGLEIPLLMDATVAQIDGFRFVYVLPLARDRLLVEDTYFSDGAALDRAAVRERALAYARSRGFGRGEVVREEAGVLPMPWRADGLPRPAAAGPLAAGYQGGWFHPATGYSFPVAARLAALVAAVDGAALPGGPELAQLAAAVRRQAAFARQLNRLLFRWCAPAERWQILERFYRLPEALIGRFYALDLEPQDMARILLGRPPRGVSLRARLRRGRA
ncbi:MAG TPA: lycopene beta-cyclase CrtY [Kofleriaceae bacterium]|nr:lycopene beta-cyclase CrtY [Kofleriaceae bacterium]